MQGIKKKTIFSVKIAVAKDARYYFTDLNFKMEIANGKLNGKRKRGLGNIDVELPMMYGKVPPQAKELEEAVLGAIMLQKDVYFNVAEIITHESFYVDAHQKIFKACTLLAQRFIPIDTLTVVEELKRLEELDLVGGPFAIVKLTNTVASTANIVYHARIIQQKFIQREVIRVGGEAIGIAYEDSAEVNELLDYTMTSLYNLTKGIFKKEFTTPENNVIEALKKLDTSLARIPGTITGKESGFKKLDENTGGWQDTDLIILAARPSTGKTTLSLNFAYNYAYKVLTDLGGKGGVGFFSLEMRTHKLINRMLSAISGIDYSKITKAKMSNEERQQLGQAADLLSKVPIYIDDTAAINSLELRSKVRRMKEKHGVGLIIIDYLQLMSPVGKSTTKNKTDEIGDISKDIKAIAKDLEVPIIALSQLNRAIESRTEDKKTPQLSDLRDSGSLEQDGDVIMFLWMDKGETFLKIAKARDGELNTFTLNRDMSIQKFTEKGSEPFRPKPDKSSKNFDEGLPEADGEDFNFKK